MNKPATKDGVGQLTLTFGFPEPKDAVQETQDNGSPTSQTALPSTDKPERKRKWHSLFDKVFALSNLQRAWEQVKANQGAAGIDRITIGLFARNASQRLEHLSQDLRNKTYRPQPVRRVHIPKSGGGERPLGIPTVTDRIVQQALRQVLEPIFEAKFSKRSHGFRPQCGCLTALSVVDRALGHGYTWVVDADIASFFDTVDYEKLLMALNEEVADGSVLRLIRFILTAGVVLPSVSESEPTEEGTPQGGPLSPLLANVYLHAFDVAITQAGYGLVRYADDFVIFTKSESEADAALDLCRHWLQDRLGLRLHPEKTRVVSVASGFEFLGFHYFRDPKTGLLCKEVRRKSVQRFRDAIRKRTPRLRTQRRVKPYHVTYSRLVKNQRVSEMIRQINVFLRGWHGYFKSVRGRYTPRFNSFDGFLRRRIRLAITGRVGSGWWNQLLTNALLRQLGLCDLETLDQQDRVGQLAVPARQG